MYDISIGIWKARSRKIEELDVNIATSAESLLLGMHTWKIIGDNKLCKGIVYNLTFRWTASNYQTFCECWNIEACVMMLSLPVTVGNVFPWLKSVMERLTVKMAVMKLIVVISFHVMDTIKIWYLFRLNNFQNIF